MAGLRVHVAVPSFGYFAKASKVLSEVEKEFINVTARSVLYIAFMDATCLARDP